MAHAGQLTSRYGRAVIPRLVVALAPVVVWSTSCCPGWCGSSAGPTIDDSSGSLLEGTSSVLADSVADGGPYYLGSPFQNVATPVDASLNPVNGDPRNPQCISLQGGVDVEMQCPP